MSKIEVGRRFDQVLTHLPGRISSRAEERLAQRELEEKYFHFVGIVHKIVIHELSPQLKELKQSLKADIREVGEWLFNTFYNLHVEYDGDNLYAKYARVWNKHSKWLKEIFMLEKGDPDESEARSVQEFMWEALERSAGMNELCMKSWNRFYPEGQQFIQETKGLGPFMIDLKKAVFTTYLEYRREIHNKTERDVNESKGFGRKRKLP